MDAQQWIASFAAELGVEPPSQEQVDRILALAGVAAHASERIAAPIACYLAGQTGKSLDDLNALALELSSSD